MLLKEIIEKLNTDNKYEENKIPDLNKSKSDLINLCYNSAYRLSPIEKFKIAKPEDIKGRIDGVYGDKIVLVSHENISGRVHLFEKDYFGDYKYKGDQDQLKRKIF